MRRDTGFTSSWRSAQQGFTLIEMLVALVIFATIAAAGTALLGFGIRAQAATAARLAAAGDLTRFASLLDADLAQALPRVTRDASGASETAFTGSNGVGAAPLLSYVRGGWSNPEGLARPGLQRVDVTLSGDRLERRPRTMADGGAADPATLLADKVASVAMRYRDPRGAWYDHWTPTRPDALPRAVEMTVTRTGAPPLTLRFLVGAVYP